MDALIGIFSKMPLINHSWPKFRVSKYQFFLMISTIVAGTVDFTRDKINKQILSSNFILSQILLIILKETETKGRIFFSVLSSTPLKRRYLLKINLG